MCTMIKYNPKQISKKQEHMECFSSGHYTNSGRPNVAFRLTVAEVANLPEAVIERWGEDREETDIRWRRFEGLSTSTILKDNRIHLG